MKHVKLQRHSCFTETCPSHLTNDGMAAPKVGRELRKADERTINLDLVMEMADRRNEVRVRVRVRLGLGLGLGLGSGSGSGCEVWLLTTIPYRHVGGRAPPEEVP